MRPGTFIVFSLSDICCRYFMATDQEGERHLYSTNTSLGSPPGSPSCLTCSLAEPLCTQNDVIMSPGTTFFIQNCAGSEVEPPFSRLIETKTKTQLLLLDRNDRLRQNLAHFSLPQVRQIMLASAPTVSGSVKLFLPPGYRETDDFTFPLLIYL